ncbi:MAG: hypothetical protein OEX12_16020, partial [Gammaproteobacteria bacterium]|nr:hypothetical protein [Gammaproteobacteria bacterium]
GVGRHAELAGEGVHTLKMVEKYRSFDKEAYPLFELCSSIIQQTEQCREYFNLYLQSQKSSIE